MLRRTAIVIIDPQTKSWRVDEITEFFIFEDSTTGKKYLVEIETESYTKDKPGLWTVRIHESDKEEAGLSADKGERLSGNHIEIQPAPLSQPEGSYQMQRRRKGRFEEDNNNNEVYYIWLTEYNIDKEGKVRHQKTAFSASSLKDHRMNISLVNDFDYTQRIEVYASVSKPERDATDYHLVMAKAPPDETLISDIEPEALWRQFSKKQVFEPTSANAVELDFTLTKTKEIRVWGVRIDGKDWQIDRYHQRGWIEIYDVESLGGKWPWYHNQELAGLAYDFYVVCVDNDEEDKMAVVTVEIEDNDFIINGFYGPGTDETSPPIGSPWLN